MRALACLLVFGLGAVSARADETAKRFVQAQQLIYLARFEQALGLIESVQPHSAEQWRTREDLLLQVYRGQKNYAGLEDLARRALAREPGRSDRLAWQLLRAELYLKADRVDSGRALLDSIWRADRSDSTVVRIAGLYEQHALSDWALATYLEAREAARDSVRFAYAVALLLEARRDYARATTEYFRAMAGDTSIVRLVENRILQLVQTEEGRGPIEAELIAAARKPGFAIPAGRLLTILYLETGRPDLAWRSAWKVDSLGSQQGLSLVMFMRQAAERGYYAVAAQAARTVMERYPASPVRHQAEWEQARMAAKTGDHADAARQYRYIAESSPAPRFRCEAALAYAGLLIRHLGQPRLADSVLRAVMAQPAIGPSHDQARLGLAYLATVEGRLDSARALLVRLQEQSPNSSLRDELTYRLAEVAYFEGDLEVALEGFTGLTADFPRSLWVNDALRRALILTAYRHVAAADVRALGRAEGHARRGQHDAALTLLAALATSSEAPLAATAIFLSAEIQRAAGRFDSAVALWDRLAATFPDDADAPEALWQAAQLAEWRLGLPQAAVSRYRKLLERYPRAHYSELARQRVRALGQF